MFTLMYGKSLKALIFIACFFIPLSCSGPIDNDENARQYHLEIAFPADDSNLGGFDTGIHIRGQIQDQFKAPLDNLNLESFTVLVNGKQANLINNDSSQWMLEVDVPKGKSTHEVQLMKNGEEQGRVQLTLDNTPVTNKLTTKTSGYDYSYSIDVGGVSIIKTNLEGKHIETLLTIGDIKNSSDCSRFYEVDISPYSGNLLVVCSDSIDGPYTYLLYDVTSKSVNKLMDGGDSYIDAMPKWVEGEYLFLAKNDVFFLVDLESGQSKELKASFGDFGRDIFPEQWFVKGSLVYMYAYIWNVREWVSFDLNNFILSDISINSITAVDEDFKIEQLSALNGLGVGSNSAYSQGFVYSVVADGIVVVDINANQQVDFALTPPELEQVLFPEEYWTSAVLVFANDQQLILRNIDNSDLYSVSLSDGIIRKVSEGVSDLFLEADLVISPDSNQMKIYSLDRAEVTGVDLENYSMTSTQVLGPMFKGVEGAYGAIDVDWDNQILYRHHVLDWAGSVPQSVVKEECLEDLLYCDESLIMAADLVSGAEEEVLSVSDLHAFLQVTDGRYEVGEVAVTQNINILWFAAMGYNPGSGESWDGLPDKSGVRGVYSYNLITSNIDAIYQEEFSDLTSPLLNFELSQYSPLLNGVVMTDWNNSNVGVLDKTGDMKDVLINRVFYSFGNTSDVDESKDLIYFDFSPKEIDFTRTDWLRNEITVLDLNSGVERAVASETLGSGMPIEGCKFQLDERRGLLIGFKLGHLMVIDTFSGDRVIKALQ